MKKFGSPLRIVVVVNVFPHNPLCLVSMARLCLCFTVISAFQLMVGGLGLSGLDFWDPWKVNQGLLRPEELPLEQIESQTTGPQTTNPDL